MKVQGAEGRTPRLESEQEKGIGYLSSPASCHREEGGGTEPTEGLCALRLQRSPRLMVQTPGGTLPLLCVPGASCCIK